MKKYLINIPSLKLRFNIYLPSKDKNRLIYFWNILNWFTVIAYSLLFFIMMFYKNSLQNSELNILSYLIFSVFIMLFIFIIRILIGGRKVLTDPPFFMSILVFALTTTAASVLVVPASPLNTFGSGSFRLIAGWTVLLFVGFFYLLRNFLNSDNRVSLLIKSIFSGYLVYLILICLTSLTSELSSILTEVTLLSSFFILYSLNTPKRKLIKVLLILILSGLAFFKFYNSQLFSLALGDIFFIMFITSLISSIILIFVYKKKYFETFFVLIENFKLLIKTRKFTDLRLFLRNFFVSILLVSPILFLGGLIYMDYAGYYSFDSLTYILQSYSSSISFLESLAKTSIPSLFTGGGFQFGFSSTYPLLANIIRVQGLLGLFAYVVLGSFGIYQYIKVLINKKFNNKLLVAVGFLTIAIPVLAIFSYPTLFLVIFWWLSITILSYFNATDLSYYELSNDKKVAKKHNSNRTLYIKIGLGIFSLVSIIYLMVVFLNIIKLY